MNFDTIPIRGQIKFNYINNNQIPIKTMRGGALNLVQILNKIRPYGLNLSHLIRAILVFKGYDSAADIVNFLTQNIDKFVQNKNTKLLLKGKDKGNGLIPGNRHYSLPVGEGALLTDKPFKNKKYLDSFFDADGMFFSKGNSLVPGNNFVYRNIDKNKKVKFKDRKKGDGLFFEGLPLNKQDGYNDTRRGKGFKEDANKIIDSLSDMVSTDNIFATFGKKHMKGNGMIEY